MKTVVVTGSQGFIGGYLVRELLNNDYKVIGVDNCVIPVPFQKPTLRVLPLVISITDSCHPDDGDETPNSLTITPLPVG
jgi:nucleoside-diphosphate-sugar epimerase